MALSIVRLGDLTTHGGKVISASTTHLICEIGIARVGDKVMCPITGHGVNSIIEGSATYLIGNAWLPCMGMRLPAGAS